MKATGFKTETLKLAHLRALCPKAKDLRTEALRDADVRPEALNAVDLELLTLRSLSFKAAGMSASYLWAAQSVLSTGEDESNRKTEHLVVERCDVAACFLAGEDSLDSEGAEKLSIS